MVALMTSVVFLTVLVVDEDSFFSAAAPIDVVFQGG
jgi:hypothetical protein